jgi:hypothetical protein
MASGNSLYITQTDTGSDRIVAFWDMRGRESFVQVTNTSSEKINIHVQIFDILSPFGLLAECDECNFDDMLTANDTHVYDIQQIMTNGIPPLLIPSVPACQGLTPNSYGFMVISYIGDSDGSLHHSPLIGMFRVIDELGYEYRANAVAEPHEGQRRIYGDRAVVNFSLANGNNLSDLVGIVYHSIDDFEVEAGPQFAALFTDILSYDSVEFDTSCSDTTFSCSPGNFDKGIDASVPNSKGEINRICATNQLNNFSSAWLDMPFAGFLCRDGDGDLITCPDTMWFHGLVGLNNGDGTGSMDSWWQEEGTRF